METSIIQPQASEENREVLPKTLLTPTQHYHRILKRMIKGRRSKEQIVYQLLRCCTGEGLTKGALQLRINLNSEQIHALLMNLHRCQLVECTYNGGTALRYVVTPRGVDFVRRYEELATMCGLFNVEE